MNCNHVQILISAFIDRELESDEKCELRKHLMSCAECDSNYQELLTLKEFLENISPEPYDFNPINSLRGRLLTEQHSFLSTSFKMTSPKMIWFRRVSLIAACISIYLLTTSMLFSNEQRITRLAANPKKTNNILTTPVSLDQNFSIDQSVSVYQASLILP